MGTARGDAVRSPAQMSGRRAGQMASMVSGFGMLLATGCTVLLLSVANRGFDGTDEGLYLALATDHRRYPTATPGAFHLWGILFTIVGHRVAWLRVMKLLAVLLVNLALGACLSNALVQIGSLQSRKDGDRRWWLLPAVAAVAGFMTYSWTPQSPGYNEASALCWLGATAAIARLPMRSRGAGLRSALAPSALGTCAVLALIAKWSGGLLLMGVALVASILMPSDQGHLRWRSCFVAAGAVATVIACQLVVLDLPDFVRGTVNVSHLLSEGSHAPAKLIAQYRHTSWRTFQLMLRRFRTETAVFLLLAVASAALSTSRSRRRQIVSASVSVVGLLPLTCALVERFWRRGGPGEIDTIMLLGPFVLLFSTALKAASFLAVRMAGQRSLPLPSGCPGVRRGRFVVLGVLAIAPLGAAFGTDNSILALVPFAFSTWMAILVVAVIEATSASRRVGQMGMVVLVVVLTCTISTVVAGVRQHPYRLGTSIDEQTVVVTKGPLTGLRLDQATKDHWDQVAAAINEASPHERPRVVGLWRSPGAIFVSRAIAVGVPWYSPPDPQLTAALIDADCAHHPGRIVVLRTADDLLDVRIERAISRCGTPFPAGFAVTATVGGTQAVASVTVLAPASGA